MLDFWSMLGSNGNATIFMEVLGGSSNVILTDNPTIITVADFMAVFPAFSIGSAEGQIPAAVFDMFNEMADKSIKFDRYKTSWKYFMCLYIAHMLTLYTKSQAGEVNLGIATSKSVDGLSISIDLVGIPEDLRGYGTWKLTTYGQQLASLTKGYGHGGLWANG